MSFGEVDTLNMLFDKLQSLFDESQGYYESFLDTNNMYKKGQISDKEFFQKLGDYTVAYSALEFLAIKVIFEMKKSLGTGTGNTQSPGFLILLPVIYSLYNIGSLHITEGISSKLLLLISNSGFR